MVVKMYVIDNLKQNIYAVTNVCFVAVPRIENQWNMHKKKFSIKWVFQDFSP